MNSFERKIAVCNIFAVIGCLLFPVCVIAAIVVGIKTEPDSGLFVIPMMLSIFTFIPMILGFTFKFTYRNLYRTAKVLFTDEELRRIDRPFYMQAFIAEKAKRLMDAGKMKNDMTEFNEFCQLAAISKPGFYGNYGGYGMYR